MQLRLAVLAVLVASGCTKTYRHDDCAGAPEACSCDGCAEGLVCAEGRCVGALAVEPVYAAHARWNDYVHVSEPTRDEAHQADVSCPSGGVADYAACVHAGELRRARLPNVSSCDALAATDVLGAFEWRCLEEPEGVSLYGRLKQAVGLKDLVTHEGWRPNQVVLRRAADVLAASAPAAWWSNPIAPLPDNGSGSSLALDEVDDDGEGPDLSYEPGTVFVLAASRGSPGYELNADRASLVTLPGVALSYAGELVPNCRVGSIDSTCLVAAASQRFVWIEGDFRAGSGPAPPDVGLLLSDVTSSVVRHSALSGHAKNVLLTDTRATRLADVVASGGGAGFDLGSSSGNRLERLAAHDSGVGIWIRSAHRNFIDASTTYRNDRGILLHSARANRLVSVSAHGNRTQGIVLRASPATSLHDISVANNAADGLVVESTSYATRITRLRAFNNAAHGLASGGLTDSTVIDVLAMNNGRSGIYLASAVRVTFSHVVAASNGEDGWQSAGALAAASVTHLLTVNNGRNGLSLVGASGSRFNHLVSCHNGSRGILLDSATDNAFAGGVLLGDNSGGDCAVSGTGAQPGLTASCANEGRSTATIRLGVSLAQSFLGKVTVDDARNGSDIEGLQSAALIGDSDWTAFAEDYRGWGPDGEGFPGAGSRGACLSGSVCRLWDLRLSAADEVLRERSGTAVSANEPFAAGAPCPSAVRGELALTDELRAETSGDGIGDDDGLCDAGEACEPANVFLLNALELIGDGAGDEDGLCESREGCVYSPNLGGYQGDGEPPEQAACEFLDGVVRQVTMRARPRNGG